MGSKAAGRCVGIVREVYNKWERRVPLSPSHVRTLIEKHKIPVLIQPSTRRIFTNDEYTNVGATVTEDLSAAGLIVGVKQVPISNLLPERTYMFFRLGTIPK